MKMNVRLSKSQRRKLRDDPDVIRSAIKRTNPTADEAAVDYCLKRWMEEREKEATYPPLNMRELIARWGDEDAVGRALLAGHLRPIEGHERLRFEWLHIVAIEAAYTIRTGLPHPHRSYQRRLRPADTFQQSLKEYLWVTLRLRRAEARENGDHVFIYYIEAIGSDTCKIGKAVCVESRFRSLRTMSAQQLQLIAVEQGPHSLERDLHRKFKAERLHGEWFRLSDTLRAHIAEVRKANGLPDWARKQERSRISRAAAAKRKAEGQAA